MVGLGEERQWRARNLPARELQDPVLRALRRREPLEARARWYQ
jgi:hypothetical protein